MLSEVPLNQDNFIYDRLYGKINFSEADLRLFQTPELTRLRSVSLAAMSFLTPQPGTCASKFEHSVGVGYLARLVQAKPEFASLTPDLYFAALVHDLGTPPFSHSSEHFQIKIFGKNHEEYVEEMLGGSELAREIKKQGGNLSRIVGLVEGKESPFGDLINGSIDLDNLDNSLRYGLSLGLFRDYFYSPQELALAFTMREGKVALQAPNQQALDGWEWTRKVVYEYVYSADHLSTAAMIFRALSFAYQGGELTPSYFRMSDTDAFNYLTQECNHKTKALMEQMRGWVFYSRVFNLAEPDLPDTLKAFFTESESRWLLADRISEGLRIPPEEVCVWLGKNKGFKKVHLPLIDGEGMAREHAPSQEMSWMAQVFVHPRWVRRAEEVREMVEEVLHEVSQSKTSQKEMGQPQASF